MDTDDEDTGNDVQESSEGIGCEAAAGSEGELRCPPCGHGAGTPQKAARPPCKLTSKDVGERDLTHCQYRAWCDHCVKGQGKDDGRPTVTGDLADPSVVRIALGYRCFQGGVATKNTELDELTEAKTSTTVLVMLGALCHSL